MKPPSRRNLFQLAAASALAGLPEFGPDVWIDVRSFGAIGDDNANDTRAVNEAIAAAARAGGGTVYFPPGMWLCGTIHAKNKVNLYIGDGATIVSAPRGYDPPEPNPWDKYQDFGHDHWKNSLIYGEDVNFMIYGPGRIWGRGLNPGFETVTTGWMWGKKLNPKYQSLTAGGLTPVLEKGIGNKTIALKGGAVVIKDITILEGGHMAILASGVDLECYNLKIDTNRDGIDIDCCPNYKVTGCMINSPHDDSIAIKTSKALGPGRNAGKGIVRGNYITGGFKVGTMLDGSRVPLDYSERAVQNRESMMGCVKVGTESYGEFGDLTIEDNIFHRCLGIEIAIVDGGHGEEFMIRNNHMYHIHGPPLFIRLGELDHGPPVGITKAGTLKQITISGMHCHGATQPGIISGIPDHPIEKVSILGSDYLLQGGGSKLWANFNPEEKRDTFPERDMFGSELPAWGLDVRHVNGFELRDVTFATQKADPRPVVSLRDVKNVHISGLKTPSGTAVPVYDQDETREPGSTGNETLAHPSNGRTSGSGSRLSPG